MVETSEVTNASDNNEAEPLELAVVMPVYNEEECIAGVVRDWLSMLEKTGVSARMIVLNDGSKDGTADALAAFAGDGRVEVINKANSGHGPTILVGYRRAVEIAPWVFQIDSDDELKPAAFPRLWSKRTRYDALFGSRYGRDQNIARGFISAVSRLTVRLFFKRGVRDVNVPYRLMRAYLLRQVIEQLPPDIFAPNVIISGALARGGARIYNMPVVHEGRKTGAVSIVKWKLWKAAFKSFRQTLCYRPTVQLKRRKA